jgi:hypothetical protein
MNLVIINFATFLTDAGSLWEGSTLLLENVQLSTSFGTLLFRKFQINKY